MAGPTTHNTLWRQKDSTQRASLGLFARGRSVRIHSSAGFVDVLIGTIPTD